MLERWIAQRSKILHWQLQEGDQVQSFAEAEREWFVNTKSRFRA